MGFKKEQLYQEMVELEIARVILLKGYIRCAHRFNTKKSLALHCVYWNESDMKRNGKLHVVEVNVGASTGI